MKNKVDSNRNPMILNDWYMFVTYDGHSMYRANTGNKITYYIQYTGDISKGLKNGKPIEFHFINSFGTWIGDVFKHLDFKNMEHIILPQELADRFIAASVIGEDDTVLLNYFKNKSANYQIRVKALCKDTDIDNKLVITGEYILGGSNNY